MTDLAVHLADLEVEAVIGVCDFERRRPQLILASIDLMLPTPPKQDVLSETVDYVLLAKRVRAVLEDGRFELLETAASELGKALLKATGAPEVMVRLTKPGAVIGARGGTSVSCRCGADAL